MTMRFGQMTAISTIILGLLLSIGCGAGPKLVAGQGDLSLHATGPKQTVPVSFDLNNVGDRPAEIKAVVPSCLCVATSVLKGKVVAAGESCKLDIQVEMPAFGATEQTIRITYGGSEEPLILTLNLYGYKKAPFVENERASAGLYSRSTDATAKLDIVTQEQPGSEPWLKELGAAEDLLNLRLLGMQEEPSGYQTMRRTYKFEASWKRLPEVRESSTDVFAKTLAADAAPIRVGEVRWSLPAN